MNRRIFLSSVIPLFLLNVSEASNEKQYESVCGLGKYKSHSIQPREGSVGRYINDLIIVYEKGEEWYECHFPQENYKPILINELMKCKRESLFYKDKKVKWPICDFKIGKDLFVFKWILFE